MRYFRLYTIFFMQYMKSLMQSRLDFFIGFLSFFMNQFFGVVFLYLIFERIPDLHGWSFHQLLFIYGFAQIPRGIDHFITDYLWLFCRKTVKEGTFDRYLLRPIDPLFQVIVERCQPDGIGEILIGGLLVSAASIKLNLDFNLLTILLFIIATLSGALIFASIKLFFASNAFYLKDAYSILFTAYNLSDFVKYPLNIYVKPLRFFLSYIIPFGFTAFIPAQYFLGVGTIATTILASCLVSGLSFFIAYSYFQYGCRHYESAGN